MNERIREENGIILAGLSRFLNEHPRLVTERVMRELTEDCALSPEEAFGILLATAMGLEIDKNPRDRRLYMTYFPEMIRALDAASYRRDPYFGTLHIPARKIGKWELREGEYAPYEAFVFDDFRYSDDGRVYPQIGFFSEPYRYPVVLEGGREWMLITPNEINTMRAPISSARGRVLTFGLGLGYYAFTVSRKPEVASVTVVERDRDVIALFSEHILPQIPQSDKIEIVCADAFDYAEREMGHAAFDTVFCDLWHDPSDGVELYLRMKGFEHHAPGARFDYWIERTMKYYL